MIPRIIRFNFNELAAEQDERRQLCCMSDLRKMDNARRHDRHFFCDKTPPLCLDRRECPPILYRDLML